MRRQLALGQRTIAVIGTILCFLIVLLLSGFSGCNPDPNGVTFNPPEFGMYTVIYTVPNSTNFAHATVQAGGAPADFPLYFRGKEDALGEAEGCDKILSYHKLN